MLAAESVRKSSVYICSFSTLCFLSRDIGSALTTLIVPGTESVTGSLEEVICTQSGTAGLLSGLEKLLRHGHIGAVTRGG